MTAQFGDDLLRQPAHLLMQGAVAELQVVKGHEILKMIDGKGHAHADADGPDGQQLDDARHPHRAERADALHGRQAHHLGPVEKQLAGAALAGIHGKLGHRLPQQFLDRFARRVIRHVKGVEINHLAAIADFRARIHDA